MITSVLAKSTATIFSSVLNSLKRSNDSEACTRNSFALGTIIQLKAYGDNRFAAIEEALLVLNDIDNRMSAFKNDSELSLINSNAGIAPQSVSEDTYFVIRKAVEYSKLSSGAFDPTVRPLVNLWNRSLLNEEIPGEREIDEKLSLVNYRDIVINEEKKTIALIHNGQAIDLGGIAKGYAADIVRDIFKKYGVNSALIDLGGNIYALGRKPDGTIWKVGIQNPFSPRGEFLGILNVENKSVVTSGNYEKYLDKDGKRYHHIIDPRTGYPSESKIISATIVSDNSLDGDGLSTGIYVLGVRESLELIEALPGIDAVLVTDDKKVYVTSGLNKSFELTDNNFTIDRSCNIR